MALLLLDLDRFKEVNDTLGHDSGDELLATIARLISRVLGGDNFGFRLGGDEFAIAVMDSADREVRGTHRNRSHCDAFRSDSA